MNVIRFTTYIVCALLLVSCQRGSADPTDITLHVSVAPNPPVLGVARITATLSDASGRPVRGAQVDFEGTMSHAGMASVTAKTTETAPGRYEAPLALSMDGDWFVIVHAALPDGRTLERQASLGTIRAP